MQGEVKSEYSDWERQLLAEGFEGLYVHEDKPDAFYPPHTHEDLTAHVILSGEMELTLFGSPHILRPGGRLDVPAHAEHAAKIGEEGCRYLVGIKPTEGFDAE